MLVIKKEPKKKKKEELKTATFCKTCLSAFDIRAQVERKQKKKTRNVLKTITDAYIYVCTFQSTSIHMYIYMYVYMNHE